MGASILCQVRHPGKEFAQAARDAHGFWGTFVRKQEGMVAFLTAAKTLGKSFTLDIAEGYGNDLPFLYCWRRPLGFLRNWVG